MRVRGKHWPLQMLKMLRLSGLHFICHTSHQPDMIIYLQIPTVYKNTAHNYSWFSIDTHPPPLYRRQFLLYTSTYIYVEYENGSPVSPWLFPLPTTTTTFNDTCFTAVGAHSLSLACSLTQKYWFPDGKKNLICTILKSLRHKIADICHELIYVTHELIMYTHCLGGLNLQTADDKDLTRECCSPGAKKIICTRLQQFDESLSQGLWQQKTSHENITFRKRRSYGPGDSSFKRLSLKVADNKDLLRLCAFARYQFEALICRRLNSQH